MLKFAPTLLCKVFKAMWMSSWVRPLDEFLDGRFIRVGEGTT
jgi:hypothetical protein